MFGRSKKLTSGQKESVEKFKGIAGTNEKVAQEWLKKNDWNLERAIDDYFSSTGGSQATTEGGSNMTAKLNALFDKYKAIGIEEGAPEDEDSIQGQGLIAFSGDLGVDPEEVTMLVVLWKLGCTVRYEIQRTEFITGMSELGCDSPEALKRKLGSFKNEIKNNYTFKSFYSFVFDYCKPPDQKSLENEMATALWPLVLAGKYKHIDLWVEFIRDKFKKAISKDTWDMFLDFIQETDDTFSNYDDCGAWPSAYDDFVDFAKAKLKL